MKYLSYLLFFIILSSCGNFQKTSESISKIPQIIIKTSNDKYDALLKYELKKLTKLFYQTKYKYELKANITFSYDTVMKIKGKNALKEMTIKLNYTLTNFSTNVKVIEDKIIRRTNYGSISSLYGSNKSENHMKERYVKKLSKTVINKIKFALTKIEN